MRRMVTEIKSAFLGDEEIAELNADLKAFKDKLVKMKACLPVVVTVVWAKDDDSE